MPKSFWLLKKPEELSFLPACPDEPLQSTEQTIVLPRVSGDAGALRLLHGPEQTSLHLQKQIHAR